MYTYNLYSTLSANKINIEYQHCRILKIVHVKHLYEKIFRSRTRKGAV